jgi:nucleoid DNA-binding protein
LLAAEAAEAVADGSRTVFDTIAAELAAGGDAAIAAFGKFSVAERAAPEGRNPRPARRSRSPPAVARSSPPRPR